MNTNYYRNENWAEKTFSRRGRLVLGLMVTACAVGIIAGGCSFVPNLGNLGKKAEDTSEIPIAAVSDTVPAVQSSESAEINVPTEEEMSNKLVGYDVVSVGRSDPFMPLGESIAYEKARNDALAEANAYNAKIAKLQQLKNTVIRLPEDTNPYSYNLPVPPTSLASPDAAAAKITRTKVVGIMYNKSNPSAIINLDNKDYLVRQGDKIIDEKYKVLQINQSWITVSLGSNIYSAGIGEMFSKDDLDKTKNDLYHLESRFGGRRS